MLERMELDETGFPQPTGELEELEADSLVLALGQEADLVAARGRARASRWTTAWSQVGPNMMTGHPGIFAGGDMVPAERTVTVGDRATASRPRRAIDALAARRRLPRRRRSASSPTLRHAQHVVLRGRARAPCSPELELARRRSTFEEVVGGLDESNALFEARRCLSCGNCFACDNCYGVCPDNAVIKLEPSGAYATRSTSTTARAAESAPRSAPAGAIRMVEETV